MDAPAAPARSKTPARPLTVSIAKTTTVSADTVAPSKSSRPVSAGRAGFVSPGTSTTPADASSRATQPARASSRGTALSSFSARGQAESAAAARPAIPKKRTSTGAARAVPAAPALASDVVVYVEDDEDYADIDADGRRSVGGAHSVESGDEASVISGLASAPASMLHSHSSASSVAGSEAVERPANSVRVGPCIVLLV
jgi:hypothetical protein